MPEEYFVSNELATEIAQMAVVGMVDLESNFSRADLAIPKLTADIAFEMREIFSISGELIFRVFMLPGNSNPQAEGQVHLLVAADRRLSPPIWAIWREPAIDWEKQIDAAKELIDSNPNLEQISHSPKNLVYYTQMFFGLLCRDKLSGKRVVVDLRDHRIVRGNGNLQLQETVLWDPVKGAESNLEQSRLDWLRFERAFTVRKSALRFSDRTISAIEVSANARQEVRGDTLADAPLYPEIRNCYCAPATGQMILKFHRFEETQLKIATVMQWVGGSNCGVTSENQAAGYRSLLPRNFEVVTARPEFRDLVREISVGRRPLASSVVGHVRAAFGWRTDPLFGDSIRVHDSGIPRNEPWNRNTLTEFTFVRERTVPTPAYY